jgi:hypothetical protein
VTLLRQPRARRAASRAVWQRHRGLVGAGTAAAVALVLVGNAAGAEMLPADKQRPDKSMALGATQNLADGQVQVQASNPELLHVSCAKLGHRWRLGWLISFDVRVHLVKGPRRLVQVDDFALVGNHKDPFSRPTSTKRRSVLPDAVMSAGMTKSGRIQFFVTKLDGTLLYNAEPSGGVAAWDYTVVAPNSVQLPGALCVPIPEDVTPNLPPKPWGDPQPLSTENGS